jgi:hypothetical protein
MPANAGAHVNENANTTEARMTLFMGKSAFS